MDKVLGLLRHALTFVGGVLVTKGYVDDAAQAESLVGAVITLIGGGWSIYTKLKSKSDEEQV